MERSARVWIRWWITLSGVLLASTVAWADSSNAKLEDGERVQLAREQELLREAQVIQAQRGGFSTTIVQPMRELGDLYVEWDRCADAVPMLDHAIQVMRAAEGLFAVSQLELFDPLEQCFIALDRQSEFNRFQDYRVLIADRTFAPKDPAMLPMLSRASELYEDAGFYISARRLYARAVDIARAAGGKSDLRMVAPLRGIARAFRMEYAHGVESADPEFNRISPFASRGDVSVARGELDRLGEASLRRAVKILEQHESREGGGSTGGVLVETLLELGDWYQMADRRKLALRTYRRAWAVAQAHLDGHETLFDVPEPLLFRSSTGVVLKRPPPDHAGLQMYWADIDYTVDRMGRVLDVKVADSDAPSSYRRDLVDTLRGTRYRPRFVDGEPVDTEHVRSRQKLWFEKQTLFRLN